MTNYCQVASINSVCLFSFYRIVFFEPLRTANLMQEQPDDNVFFWDCCHLETVGLRLALR